VEWPVGGRVDRGVRGGDVKEESVRNKMGRVMLDDNSFSKIEKVLKEHDGCRKWMRTVEGLLRGEVALEEGVEEMIEGKWEELKCGLNQVTVHCGKVRKDMRGQVQKSRKKVKWDREVFRLWIRKRRLFKLWKEEWGNDRIRLEYRSVCKEIKKLLRKKRRAGLRRRIREIESLRTEDVKGYWKKLKVVGDWDEKKDNLPSEMNDSHNVRVRDIQRVWRDAFAKIGVNNVGNRKYNIDHAERLRVMNERISGDRDKEVEEYSGCVLNGVIDQEEVNSVIKRLKNGKAMGVDGIRNEVLKYGGKVVRKVVWWYCCLVWTGMYVPTEWMKALIFPIFKEGDEYCTDNYRPISLLSVVSKVFSAVLNARLTGWCESRGIFVEEQGGFRNGRGCRDQLFALSEVIRLKKKYAFCAYLDVRKAYDTVFRDGLWSMMYESGIRGRMWYMLKGIYRDVRSAVLVNQGMTDDFPVQVGVRQGCVLSPLLYSIFINNIVEAVKAVGCGMRRKEGDRELDVSCLLYADDIVLIAESEVELQYMLDAVFEYSRLWRFEFNAKKSEVVVYGCSLGNGRKEWWLGGGKIKRVKSYKYLGTMVSSEGGWKEEKCRRLKKARENMRKALGMGVGKGVLSVQEGRGVWEALVRSVLEFGCEVWGGCVWGEAEKLQLRFGKRILRGSSGMANEVVLGELGWWTLKGRRDFLRLKYWGVLRGMKYDRITRVVYEVSRTRFDRGVDGNNWCAYTYKLCCELGLLEYWEGKEVGIGEWEDIVRKRVHVREVREWRRRMGLKPKLRLYRKLKSSLVFEEYLKGVTHDRGKMMMLRMRSGTSELRLETGRWVNENLEDRLCRLCGGGGVEDENHVINECVYYQDDRALMWDGIRDGTEGRVMREGGEMSVRWVLGWRDIDRYSEGDWEVVLRCAGKFLLRVVVRRRRWMEVYKLVCG
jgi:hypothetical protein